MNYLSKEFREFCKMNLKTYGFKSYGNTRWRVVNDVFQTFSLFRSLSGDACTINFGIRALCSNYVTKNSSGPYSLKDFDGDKAWGINSFFFYYGNSPESCKGCMNEMGEYIFRYLIPFFQKGSDCRGAYTQCCEIEKLHNGEVQMVSDKYAMALKFGDYDLALEHMNAIIKQNEEAYSHNYKTLFRPKIEQGIIPDEYIKYKEMFDKDISERKGIRDMILRRNNEEISHFITVNERQSLQKLGIIKR